MCNQGGLPYPRHNACPMTSRPLTAAQRSIPGECYQLSRNALQRLLAHSPRAPSWLREVLEAGQVIYLAPDRATGRAYALAFDALEDSYLVAVLGLERTYVVTVLTVAQYENKMGTVKPVFFSLAQLVRLRSAVPALPTAEADLDGLFGRHDCEGRGVGWQVYLGFTAECGAYRERGYSLGPTVRSSWLLKEVYARLIAGAALEFPLALTCQAALLVQNRRFHAWVLRTVRLSKESLLELSRVQMRPTVREHARIDVTDVLLQQLGT